MGPIIRILLRYATAPLLYYGMINEGEASDLIADPQIAQWISLGLGMAAPIVSEGWYWLAKKFGRPT